MADAAAAPPAAAPPAGTRTPADFLKSIRGRPVVVRLNSGADYRGKKRNGPREEEKKKKKKKKKSRRRPRMHFSRSQTIISHLQVSWPAWTAI
jgi:hypothetical protein